MCADLPEIFYRHRTTKTELIFFSGIRLVQKRRRLMPEIGATVKKAKTGREVALKKEHGVMAIVKLTGLGYPAVRMASWPL